MIACWKLESRDPSQHSNHSSTKVPTRTSSDLQSQLLIFVAIYRPKPPMQDGCYLWRSTHFQSDPIIKSFVDISASSSILPFKIISGKQPANRRKRSSWSQDGRTLASLMLKWKISAAPQRWPNIHRIKGLQSWSGELCSLKPFSVCKHDLRESADVIWAVSRNFYFLLLTLFCSGSCFLFHSCIYKAAWNYF